MCYDVVLPCFSRFDKLVVEVVGANGVGKLAKVHLKQRRDRVDVLQNGAVVAQLGNPVLVEGNSAGIETSMQGSILDSAIAFFCVPESLNVGRDSAQPVDAVDDSVALDEFGAVDQHFGH